MGWLVDLGLSVKDSSGMDRVVVRGFGFGSVWDGGEWLVECF